jgi:hypothetical protein
VDIKFTDEELVKLDPSTFKKAEQAPQAERQKAFDELCKQCMSREFKPNWARVRYQKLYGEWPTWKSGIRTPPYFKVYEKDFLQKQILAEVSELGQLFSQ